MSRPTRSTVNQWDLPALLAQADGLDGVAENLTNETRSMVATAMRAGDSRRWVGVSQRACEDRTVSDQGEFNKLGSDVIYAANVLRNTANAIMPNRNTALIKATGLEMDEFRVDDDWTVTDARDYSGRLSQVDAGSQGEHAIRNEMAQREREAANSTRSLQSLADQMGQDDQSGAAALDGVFASAEINAPLMSGLSPQQAGRDAMAIARGHATSEQRERFTRATTLTPEQNAALRMGNEAVIPKGQLDYLQGFYSEAGRGGLDGLRSFADGDESMRTALANGMHVLANPRIRTDQIQETFGGSPVPPAGVPGAVTDPRIGHVRGGLSQLPSAVKDVLSKPAIESDRTRWGDPERQNYVSSTGLTTFDDLKKLNDILSHGDRSSQLGSDIDRSLIARASEIAGGATEGKGLYSIAGAQVAHHDVEGLLNGMLDIAGEDEIAVHDALMTGRDGGPGVLAEMPMTYDIDGNENSYDASDAVRRLMTFNWTEGQGNEDSGVNNLFNWMQDHADGAPRSSPVEYMDSVRAGESVGELARIIHENKTALVDIGSGDSALGERNAELTQTLAKSLSPYIAELAGAEEDVFTTNGVSALDGPGQLKSVFQVMDSDPEAGRLFNTSAILQSEGLEQRFGSDTNQTDLGRIVGRIHGAMEAGLDDQLAEDVDDENYKAAKVYAEKGALLDGAAGLSKLLPGLNTPIGSAALDGVMPSAKLSILGLPEDQESIEEGSVDVKLLRGEQTFVQERINPDERYVNMLEGYAKSHPDIRHDPRFSEYFVGEKLDVPKNMYGRLGRDLKEMLGAQDNDFDDFYQDHYIHTQNASEDTEWN
ncbi:hypothetical protein VX037_09465 [Gordonia sp. Z-3]|uniref:TPR repeat region-containing protein n=1 Tax=Gordonia sp. Z-3 TaxID=3115408 RepID=UPI002E2C7100|nr:hypothetical protein [Gordonia sp. Z-3]MED5801250.1 hypothetical protein [Gordonia sp. Z-3]